MNPVTWSALSHESLIGPPSELVDVGDFLRGARDNSASVFTPLALLQQAANVGPAQQGAIMSECSVDDVRSKLIDIFNDPRLYAHARRGMTHLLADIKSKSWPLPPEAAIFMRGPKNSDINTLAEIKYSGNGSNPAPQSTIVVVSVYNRLAWSYNFVYRNSQHAYLYYAIPCPPNETPDERVVDGTFVGYRTGSSTRPSGYVVVIEGTAYRDGSTEIDYASKEMRDISISSLLLRLNHPFLHLVFCILTTPLTPLLGNRRACTKVPAVYSVEFVLLILYLLLLRLGESPCLLRAPC
ncbi:hypothetical protein EDB89DRAFT_1930202 [Lactarius sanguifluus]|nr:hypothetical protein EDB89DRAFT_1930202 [Lactarius sanguifluus]